MNDALIMFFASVSLGLGLGLLVFWLGRSLRPRLATSPSRSWSQRRLQERERALAAAPTRASAVALLQAVAPLAAGAHLRSLREYLARSYADAGYPGGLEDTELTAAALLLGAALSLLLGLAGLLILPPIGLVFGLLGLPAAVLYVGSSLKAQIELRNRRILSMLPYAVDLLVLALRSGASLPHALERVVQTFADDPIGEVFGQVLAETQMGADRREAMTRMAQRLDIEEMQALVDNITQSEELGWPLAETLSRFSDRMLRQRALKAQEYAGTACVMIMLPSTLVLASVILVLFGPLIVRYLRGELGVG